MDSENVPVIENVLDVSVVIEGVGVSHRKNKYLSLTWTSNFLNITSKISQWQDFSLPFFFSLHIRVKGTFTRSVKSYLKELKGMKDLLTRPDVWSSEGTLYTPHFQPVSLPVMISDALGLDRRKLIINWTQTNKIHTQKRYPSKKTIMETLSL